MGSTHSDWSWAFHAETEEVALSSAGSEVARVKCAPMSNFDRRLVPPLCVASGSPVAAFWLL